MSDKPIIKYTYSRGRQYAVTRDDYEAITGETYDRMYSFICIPQHPELMVENPDDWQFELVESLDNEVLN